MEQRLQGTEREMLLDGSNWPKHLNPRSKQHRRESIGVVGMVPREPSSHCIVAVLHNSPDWLKLLKYWGFFLS